jgi:5'-nucleotidase
MRILITNDDGIHAEGLDICDKIARSLSDDVWVVAPEYDQSGVAHSLSLNNPLRLRQVAERRFAVRGTPTDCIIMGARHLLNGKGPDLVLSFPKIPSGSDSRAEAESSHHFTQSASGTARRACAECD